MAELLVDFITSLDGYGAAEGWPGWWGMEGPEYLAWLEDSPERDYTLLMGGTTYRMFAEFQDAGLDSPEERDSVNELAEARKLVFSRTLAEPYPMPNTTVVRIDPVAEVRALKEAGTSLRTIGSLSVCRTLLVGGVVDRFRVVLFPVVTGATGQDRIYDGWPDVALELVDSRLFDGKLQLLEYVPTVLDAPPGA